jgi:hypothetical protein
MSVTIESIQRSLRHATFARDNIAVKSDGKWYPKVCCICDRHILVGKENKIKLDHLKNKNIYELYYKDQRKLLAYNLTEEAIRNIQSHYTIKCLPPNEQSKKLLMRLYLSPRSYMENETTKTLGACTMCQRSIHDVIQKKSTKLAPFAIANDLMIGKAPEELTSLTEFELSMISLARIDKHVFMVEGGTHKAMKGWHSMYANDVASVMRAANFCTANLENSESSSDDDTKSTDVEANTEIDHVVGGSKKYKLASVLATMEFMKWSQKATT